jgi:hypothetical protein
MPDDSTSVPFDLHVALSGYTAPPLTVHSALATMVVAQNGASAARGVVAGVLDTQELITWSRQMAGTISMALCSGSAFDSVVQQIQEAVGLGFDATAVKLGSAVAVPTSPPVCSP